MQNDLASAESYSECTSPEAGALAGVVKTTWTWSPEAEATTGLFKTTWSPEATTCFETGLAEWLLASFCALLHL